MISILHLKKTFYLEVSIFHYVEQMDLFKKWLKKENGEKKEGKKKTSGPVANVALLLFFLGHASASLDQRFSCGRWFGRNFQSRQSAAAWSLPNCIWCLLWFKHPRPPPPPPAEAPATDCFPLAVIRLTLVHSLSVSLYIRHFVFSIVFISFIFLGFIFPDGICVFVNKVPLFSPYICSLIDLFCRSRTHSPLNYSHMWFLRHWR